MNDTTKPAEPGLSDEQREGLYALADRIDSACGDALSIDRTAATAIRAVLAASAAQAPVQSPAEGDEFELRRLLAEERETNRQLIRALAEATEGPTFMGEPVLTARDCPHCNYTGTAHCGDVSDKIRASGGELGHCSNAQVYGKREGEAKPQPKGTGPKVDLQSAVQRALSAWDTTTLKTAGDGMLCEAMESLRAEFDGVAQSPAPAHELPAGEPGTSIDDGARIVARVMEYQGKARRQVVNPCLTARECIALANYIAASDRAHYIQSKTQGEEPVERIMRSAQTLALAVHFKQPKEAQDQARENLRAVVRDAIAAGQAPAPGDDLAETNAVLLAECDRLRGNLKSVWAKAEAAAERRGFRLVMQMPQEHVDLVEITPPPAVVDGLPKPVAFVDSLESGEKGWLNAMAWEWDEVCIPLFSAEQMRAYALATQSQGSGS